MQRGMYDSGRGENPYINDAMTVPHRGKRQNKNSGTVVTPASSSHETYVSHSASTPVVNTAATIGGTYASTRNAGFPHHYHRFPHYNAPPSHRTTQHHGAARLPGPSEQHHGSACGTPLSTPSHTKGGPKGVGSIGSGVPHHGTMPPLGARAPAAAATAAAAAASGGYSYGTTHTSHDPLTCFKGSNGPYRSQQLGKGFHKRIHGASETPMIPMSPYHYAPYHASHHHTAAHAASCQDLPPFLGGHHRESLTTRFPSCHGARETTIVTATV